MLQNFTQVNNFPPQVSSCNHSSSIVVMGVSFNAAKHMFSTNIFSKKSVMSRVVLMLMLASLPDMLFALLAPVLLLMMW